MEVEQAKTEVHRVLGEVKACLAQEAPPKLSEADTKQYFIEPIVAALGWRTRADVQREYYAKSSQEFIDYVMKGVSGPLLAIEAKPLQTDLSEKNAAQLIQYCAVEGIEWAALTNGRELQFFNAYLTGDLAAKRILRLDLVAWNSDAEFDALFELLWLLSRESMTTPAGVRAWWNRKCLDAIVRSVLVDPGSAAVRAIRKALIDAGIKATSQDITQWFGSQLGSELAPLPAPVVSGGKTPTVDVATGATSSANIARPRFDTGGGASVSHRARRKQHYSVRLSDLVSGGFIRPGTTLSLMKGSHIVVSATVDHAGSIQFDGGAYRAPSDKVFAKLMGNQSLNGWEHWHANLPEGHVSLAELRRRWLERRQSGADAPSLG